MKNVIIRTKAFHNLNHIDRMIIQSSKIQRIESEAFQIDKKSN